MMKNSIQLVIADDHEIFRQGFLSMIKKEKRLSVIGQAKDGEELVELVVKNKPDVAFVDISMPKMDGIEATRIITERSPLTHVIALSMFNDDNHIIDMLEAGASGYLLKNTTLEEVLKAIDSVMKGDNYFCNDASVKLVRLITAGKNKLSRTKTVASFTDREIEIMNLMCEQLTIKEIADQLGLSPRTIETYRVALQEKTASRNSIGIVLYAIQNGIVKI
jgi:DNA-binding NarL/FixJ family response regulator